MARKPADKTVNAESILLAAADVISRKGFESTSMRDIAEQVDLTAASIYHHFKNKDFLLLTLMERMTEEALDTQQSIVSSDMPPAQKLATMIKAHINMITDNLPLLSAHVLEIRSLLNVEADFITRDGGRFRDEFVARRERYFVTRAQFEQCFRSVIAYGIESGEFRQVDVFCAAQIVLGAMNSIGVWYRDGGRLSGAEVADVFADMLVAGLLADPEARQEL